MVHNTDTKKGLLQTCTPILACYKQGMNLPDKQGSCFEFWQLAELWRAEHYYQSNPPSLLGVAKGFDYNSIQLNSQNYFK